MCQNSVPPVSTEEGEVDKSPKGMYLIVLPLVLSHFKHKKFLESFPPGVVFEDLVDSDLEKEKVETKSDGGMSADFCSALFHSHEF